MLHRMFENCFKIRVMAPEFKHNKRTSESGYLSKKIHRLPPTFLATRPFVSFPTISAPDLIADLHHFHNT